MRYHLQRTAFTVMAICAAWACATEPQAPTTEQLAGQYRAGDDSASDVLGVLEFTTMEDGVTTDWVQRGAHLTIILSENGTVTGRLFVPGADEDGGDFDQPMDGTWTSEGAIVRLTQSADTFVRDVDWTWTGDRLTADHSFSDVRVSVVLERTEP